MNYVCSTLKTQKSGVRWVRINLPNVWDTETFQLLISCKCEYGVDDLSVTVLPFFLIRHFLAAAVVYYGVQMCSRRSTDKEDVYKRQLYTKPSVSWYQLIASVRNTSAQNVNLKEINIVLYWLYVCVCVCVRGEKEKRVRGGLNEEQNIETFH